MPEKIKVFIWRAIKGNLPTAENLAKKRVLAEATCKVCEEGVEDFNHCFRFCRRDRQVWLLSPFGILATEAGIFTEREWLINIVQCLDKEQTALFFILA